MERQNDFEFMKQRVADFIERLDEIVTDEQNEIIRVKEQESKVETDKRLKRIIKTLKKVKLYSENDEMEDYGDKFRDERTEMSRGDRSNK